MDWKTEIDSYIAELKGIVALLFSLAFMADRAALGSIAMRRDLLDIIWPAELSALRSIHLAAFDLGVPISPLVVEPKDTPPLAIYGDDHIDARNLAVRLRALAFILAYLVLLAQRLAHEALHDDGITPSIFIVRIAVRRFGNPDPALTSTPQPAIRAPPALAFA